MGKPRTPPPQRYWTKKDEALLRKLYPHKSTKVVAKALRRTICAVYGHADKLGLNKSAKYLAGPEAYRLRRGDNVGAAFRFGPGHVPANKGLRRPGWAPGRMAQTQFKKGNRPHTWRPIGSTRLLDGYLQRKVSDTGYTPRDWKSVHVLVWEEQHGAVPAGHAVVFKDRDRQHISLDNLELLSRSELMLRNTIHNLPKELAQVIQLTGALNRQIRKRINGQKHDGRSSQSSVRDLGSAQG